MIKIIFFDFAGVLFSISDFEHLYLPKGIGVDAKKIIEITDRFDESGRVSDNNFLSIVSKELGFKPKKLKKKWLSIYKKNGKLVRSVYKVAFSLKRHGYRIGILSNAKKMHADINVKMGAYKGFNPVILSYKVRMVKPDKKIYALACRRARVRPSEAVLIDDRIVNVKGARAFGMRAILYKNPGQLKRELKKLNIKF
ncbi:MAG TPA: HAD family phosphatase [archaeon]|nr:HAD family phosphatase [archaeon]